MDELRMVFNGMDIVDKLGTTEIGQPKLVIADVVGRSVTTVENETVGVPGKAGSHLLRDEQPHRVLEVPFILRGETHEQLRADVDKLSELLVTPHEVNISFNDEPYTYYGKLEGEVPLTEHRTTAKGTLTFICPDPYKYGTEKSETFSDGHVLTNEGTAETSPVFRATAKQSATFLDIVKENGEYMRVGDPGRLDQIPYSPSTTILTESGSSVVGWTDASYVDNGYVGGQMVGTVDGFHPQAYGLAQEPHGWQGPAKKRSLPEPVGGIFFEANVDLKNLGNSNETGMIEVYFLDANNNTVAKVGIEDVWRGANRVQGKMQLGPDNSDRYADYHTFDTAWNNFQGKIGFYRYMADEGHYLMLPYFAYIEDDGTFRYVSERRRFIDFADKYTADITQIQVAMRAWPVIGASEMYIRGIVVKKRNEQPGGIPYIVEPGDEIEVDHQKAVIRINGEERNDLKYDFGSDYFDLDFGINKIYTFPKGAYDTEVIWRDAYK
ncbi:distal tail protein Dit [Salimicrobium album]|uniref:Phage tail component, N-terminal domain-containing protein n=1 Tax=Salimicrobium album TaxID=50717 RepID=A0A1H3DB49_9BACI|nr:distal tail protein Dit [Salimicrobium album]SDX62954.1 putative phage tail component, N-terminal domain-containing protein [Salimicrobium album]